MVCTSGYITEFNKETNIGYIQRQDDEQRFRFHLHSLKTHSRRYVTNAKFSFVGELFDFDTIQGEDNTEEAVNVRHRVLVCTVPGCSRITAFTNVKALNEHIERKHLTIKKVVEKSPLPAPIKKKVNKPEKVPLFIVNLPAQSPSTLGRFIGKNGVHLKLFELENKVRLKILPESKVITTSTKDSQVRVQVRPSSSLVKIELIRTKLQSAWQRAVREQNESDHKFQRLSVLRKDDQKLSSFTKTIPIESDSRSARAFTIVGDECVRRRRRRRTIEAVRKPPTDRSRSNVEGRRSAASTDLLTRARMTHNKKTASMKYKQWLLNDQLFDM